MRFCETDEVKVDINKIDYLFFCNPSLVEDVPNLRKILKKKSGIILEYDFCKKKKVWTYFVDFGNDLKLWFLEEELILI